MEPVIIVHYGELALKGKNRQFFVRRLMKNIRTALDDLDGWSLAQTHGRLFVEFTHDTVFEQGDGGPEEPAGEHVHQGLQFRLAREVEKRLRRLPGIVAVSPGIRTHLDIESVYQAAEFVFGDALRRINRPGVTFKVETRRPNKSFPMTSPEVSSDVGGHLLRWAPDELDVTVDVHDPDVRVEVELRRQAYVRAGSVSGPGGLPVGSSGRGMALLSGGIDSPVALWLALKRGIEMHAVHFHSFPFTSDRARQKVEDICAVLAPAASRTLRLHVVRFTEIQKLLQADGPPELLTILMRRSMMRIATAAAREAGALVLVTGESVGQVASQTLESITVTNAAAGLPVLRPVITYDKNEIIALARRLGTYDISILPYEDCCALFVPEKPKTRPRLADVTRAEERLELEPLELEAVDTRETATW